MSEGSAILSRREMREWCGSPRRERQIGFLRLNAIPFDQGLDGWPKVRRWVFEGRARPAQDTQSWKPNKVA